MSSYLHKSCLTVLLTLLAVSVGACESTEPAPGEGVFYADDRLGLEITEFEEWAESVEVLDDGSTELYGEALVSIEGRGSHPVEAYALIDSVANGALRTFATTDLDTGAERVFHFEPHDNAIVIGDFDGGVFLFGNPDGTYDVALAEFEAPASEDQYLYAEDGYEAYQIVSDFNEFSSSSPHSVVMALAMGKSPLLEARGVPSVDDDFDESAADGPPVCQGFPELCECVGCWAADSSADHCTPCGM